jgi:hypothetical protein
MTMNTKHVTHRTHRIRYVVALLIACLMSQSFFIPWKGRVEAAKGNNTISIPIPTTFGNPNPTGGRTIDLGGGNTFRTILPAHLDKPFRNLSDIKPLDISPSSSYFTLKIPEKIPSVMPNNPYSTVVTSSMIANNTGNPSVKEKSNSCQLLCWGVRIAVGACVIGCTLYLVDNTKKKIEEEAKRRLKELENRVVMRVLDVGAETLTNRGYVYAAELFRHAMQPDPTERMYPADHPLARLIQSTPAYREKMDVFKGRLLQTTAPIVQESGEIAFTAANSNADLYLALHRVVYSFDAKMIGNAQWEINVTLRDMYDFSKDDPTVTDTKVALATVLAVKATELNKLKPYPITIYIRER